MQPAVTLNKNKEEKPMKKPNLKTIRVVLEIALAAIAVLENHLDDDQ